MASAFVRAAPHVFTFTVVLCAVIWIGVTAVPRTAGDELYDGPLVNDTPIPFRASEGDVINFRVKAEYPERAKGPQFSNLTVETAEGKEVWRASAGFIVIKSGTADRSQAVVTPAIPPFPVNETGEYRVRWIFDGGTPSTDEIKVVANGVVIQRARAEGAMLVMIASIFIGMVAFLGIRPVNPDAKGRAKYWPVKGATGASMGVAAALAVAVGVALVAWVLAKIG